MSVEIKKVETKSDLKKFIRFNYELYKDNAYSVPDLYEDMLNTFSTTKNPAFEFCEAEYFLALQDGKIVGRVAAIINNRANSTWNQKVVRFGWIDFIDDKEVSRALIDTVKSWGKERGMTELQGPLGFTDMDREGMMVEGFDRLSTMYVNYNFPYYMRHMEHMEGFEKDNDYVEFRIKVPEVIPPKFAKIGEMIEKRYDIHVHKFTRHELLHEGKGRRVFEIINATFKELYGYSELSDAQITQLVNEYIKVADLDLVSSVVDATRNNEMVGVGICFPSFSKALQKTRDGRLFPFGWWQLLKVLKWHKTDTVDLLMIAVLPEYRKKGANALIFNDLISRFRKCGFQWAEAMHQMESNHAVQNEWTYFDSELHRRHRCYRKSL